MDHFLPLGDIDDETWDRVMAVNVTGVMRLSRAVLPLMPDAGGGAIVTVASKAPLGAGASGVAGGTASDARCVPSGTLQPGILASEHVHR